MVSIPGSFLRSAQATWHLGFFLQLFDHLKHVDDFSATDMFSASGKSMARSPRTNIARSFPRPVDFDVNMTAKNINAWTSMDTPLKN